MFCRKAPGMRAGPCKDTEAFEKALCGKEGRPNMVQKTVGYNLFKLSNYQNHGHFRFLFVLSLHVFVPSDRGKTNNKTLPTDPPRGAGSRSVLSGAGRSEKKLMEQQKTQNQSMKKT